MQPEAPAGTNRRTTTPMPGTLQCNITVFHHLQQCKPVVREETCHAGRGASNYLKMLRDSEK
jgi:hypothetical protein